MKFDDLNDFIIYLCEIKKTNKIYIWGIGVYGELIGKLLNKEQISWEAYFDNCSREDILEINGKKIFNPLNKELCKDYVYILSLRNYESVKKQLNDVDIKDENIIWFENIDVFNQIKYKLIDFKKYTEKLNSFHNLHKGEKCFIIGNGPSLTINDLEKIHESKIISFASNYIFKCYDKTKWRPDYYFGIDIQFIRDIYDEKDIVENILNNSKYAFTRTDGKFFDFRDDINLKNLRYFNSIYSNSENDFNFSDDCSKEVYIGYTVTYAMIQMAVYMGFNEIYLLGMDHTYSIEINEDGKIVKNENINDHSEILEHYKLSKASNIHKTTKAYEAAKKYTDKKMIKIYNATRGGRLEVFERINLDDVF